MGILNVTPDSFSGDGSTSLQSTVYSLQFMIEHGADIIDVGGESTGPGSKEVSAEDELNRLKTVIDYVAENKLADEVLFSIDTYKSEVAEYALRHGFGMVNDVTALRGDEKMLSVLLKYQPYVVLMYSKDPTARTSKEVVEYEDVLKIIKGFLLERAQVLLEAGFPKDKIILDPGMGAFVSANPKYSFEIIERLPELSELGYPVLIGISRKSCLGGRLEDRDPPSVEWSLKAIEKGANVVRVHNVSLMKSEIRKTKSEINPKS